MDLEVCAEGSTYIGQVCIDGGQSWGEGLSLALALCRDDVRDCGSVPCVSLPPGLLQADAYGCRGVGCPDHC